MNKKLITSLLLAAGLTVCSSMALAAEQADKAQSAIATDKTVAITALNTMSEYLRSLDSFVVHADTNADEVLDSGQKIELSRSVVIKADPPSGLWVKTSSMYTNQEFFFDGKTFTITTPDLGYYASFDAPATIGKAIVKARDKFDIELPLSDLFLWGTQQDASETINEAIVVGVDQINGVICTQFAFREDTVDWQLWIQRGDTPLPLKLVITSKDDKQLPRYSAVLKWDTASVLSGQSFTFTPSAADKKINFQTAETTK